MKKIYLERTKIDKLSIFDKGGYEGNILLYSNDLLLKQFHLYLKNFIDFDRKMYKLDRIASKNISEHILVKVEKLVFSDDNQFVGYIMKKISNSLNLDMIRDPIALLNIYKILFKNLNVLHNNNIIVGDLKPSNILVDQNGNPIFIDADSMGVDEIEIDHADYRSSNTRTISNIEKLISDNDRKDIDKLMLLACFINSISNDSSRGKNLTYKIFNSDKISMEMKKELCKLVNSPNMDVENLEISGIFEEEQNRKNR